MKDNNVVSVISLCVVDSRLNGILHIFVVINKGRQYKVHFKQYFLHSILLNTSKNLYTKVHIPEGFPGIITLICRTDVINAQLKVL